MDQENDYDFQPSFDSSRSSAEELSSGNENNAAVVAPPYQISSTTTENGEEESAVLWQGSVTASTLNVRRGNSRGAEQVRTVSRDDVVDVYEVDDGWYRISSSSQADQVEWVSGTYVQRVNQGAPAENGEIPQVDLSGNANSRAHNRWVDDGEESSYAAEYDETINEIVANFFGEGKTRQSVLAEIDTLDTEGRVEEADAMRRKLFIATQHAIVEVLDVENSSMYAPGGGKTYCNIYAYDFVTAMGAYIPRVWWSESAIAKIQAGESVSPKYGDTIFEMNANALNNWMPDYGVDYGWRKVTDMNTAQEEVNSGKIGVILAANKLASRSGHITVILSETEQEQASREEGALPLASQAGSSNHERHRPSSAWWENSSHKDGAAWIFDGEINSPIMSPEQSGINGAVDQGKSLEEQIENGEDLIATNYLLAVQQLEELAAQDGYSTIQTLSALRKLYYDSGNWNTAIADAADTGFPPSWTTDSAESLREAVAGSQVVMINGVSVDVGHLLTGLDATNYNESFSLSRFGIDIFTFRDNKEFVTYVGDIGSAVEAYIDERKESEYFVGKDDEALLRHYNSLAGDVDMAGNADSYAMDFDPTVSFSENLINYTSGENRADDKRFTKFAESIGLGRLENGVFSNYNEEWKEALSDEVSQFAQAYQMREGVGEGILGWGGIYHYNKVSGWMIDVFIQRMIEKVQSENTE